MRSFTRLSLSAVLVLGLATTASAQATRTWVSGVGDDVNPCSRTAPCKTFAGAISKTASGGEINVLDPGGFGTVNITKPLTIDGSGGPQASILSAGTTGIIINTSGANDVVTIRNLSINGVNQTASPGVHGIRIINGKNVHIEKCAIFNMGTRGIFIETTAANTKVFVRDSTIRSNGEGIGSIPVGGNVILSVEDSHIDQNTGHGVNMSLNTKGSFSGSTFNGNGASGILAQATTVDASIHNCNLSGNAQGIFAGFGGGAPTIRVSHSMVTGNTTQGIFLNGGTVTGFSSNMIAGNTGNNSVTSSVAQQ